MKGADKDRKTNPTRPSSFLIVSQLLNSVKHCLQYSFILNTCWQDWHVCKGHSEDKQMPNAGAT